MTHGHGYEQPERISEVVLREPIDSTRTRWVNRVRSADHKVIGTTLIGFSLILLVLAGFTELLGWLHLATPDSNILTPERFYALHTLSNTSFLYLFALPLFAGLATYIVPLQIGSRSTAFPRLNALGTWMIVGGGAFLFFSLFFNVWEGGFHFSSSQISPYYSSAPGADFWLVSTLMVASGLSLIAIDIAATYKNMRADGMTRDRVPIFSYVATVFSLGILATAPVLVAACLIALIERQWELFGVSEPVHGGDALLWKSLFGWWTHSAPFLVTLMAAGAATEVLQTATRTRFADRGLLKKAFVAYAVLAILGFGRIYFGSPVAVGWHYIFMVIGLALLVPSALLIASWIKMLRDGGFRSSPPALFAIVFVGFFTFAAVTQVALSFPTLGAWLNGSELGYAAWHNLVWGSASLGGFAGLLYWFPKITGRNFDHAKAKLALAMIAIGTAVALLSMSSLGVDGVARELAELPNGFGQARIIEAGLGTLLAALGALGLLINMIASNADGALAGNDPWHAGTLEWYAPSPPPLNNFDSIPAVTSETPMTDVRERVLADTGDLAGTVSQSPTAGRPSLRESDE